MIYAVLERLANGCDWVAEQFTEAARRLRYCPDCGRNRFYGEACR